MSIEHGWNFPREFGFTESAKGNDNARSFPKIDPAGDEGDGTYVQKARGGRIHKADGGDVTSGQSFGSAFHAARQAAMAGGPKTFTWNGKSYTTDLAPDASPSTGRAHTATPRGAHPPSAETGSLDTNAPDTGHYMDEGTARPSGQGTPNPNPSFGRAHYVPYVDNQPVGARLFGTGSKSAPSAPSEDPSAREAAARKADFAANYSEPAKAASSDDGYRRGGRIHKAMGGALGQMPSGAPGQVPPPMDNPMSRATVTMPVPDTHKMATGMLTAGKVAGAEQAVNGLAQAARTRMRGAPRMAGVPAPMSPPMAPHMAKGGHLDAAARHALPRKDFALPGGRFPINDANHARNALARVSQFGSSEEKAEVRGAVHRKFPGIGKK